MIEDVKILTSPDKAAVERFIMEYSDKWYYKNDFKTNTIYDSFQFSWAYKVYYTVVMVKYKEEPIENSPVSTITSAEDLIKNVHVTTTSIDEPIEYTWFKELLDNNTEQNATEIWGEGELPTATEQVHSEEWGRGKKGKNSEKEVSTTSDSSSIHEGE